MKSCLLVLLLIGMNAQAFDLTGLIEASKANLLKQEYAEQIYEDLYEIVIDKEGLPRSIRGNTYFCAFEVYCKKGRNVKQDAKFHAVYEGGMQCVSYAPQISSCGLNQ